MPQLMANYHVTLRKSSGLRVPNHTKRRDKKKGHTVNRDPDAAKLHFENLSVEYMSYVSSEGQVRHIHSTVVKRQLREVLN